MSSAGISQLGETALRHVAEEIGDGNRQRAMTAACRWPKYQCGAYAQWPHVVLDDQGREMCA